MTPSAQMLMPALLAAARHRQPELIRLIRELVCVESPSDDPEAVSACAAVVTGHVRTRLGGRVKLHRKHGYGNIVEARFGARLPAGKQAQRLLILGHLDTVWPQGTLAEMPCQLRNGRLYGPGVLDMKAGVAMALMAIELLQLPGIELLKASGLPNPLKHKRLNKTEGLEGLRSARSALECSGIEIILLLNSEEEIGSPVSRLITEHLAQECAAVFVLEPAQGLAYKTARKGTGNWRIEVAGVAAHAGVDFEKGHNAIRELARQIEIVSQWTDLKRGLTINVGTIGGGTKINVIPAAAWAEVDVRIERHADGVRMARKFATLKPIDKACSLTVTGGINRPPMQRTRGTVQLFRKAQRLALELGISLDEASTGGASDGNFTASLGVATLDGMGAVGEGAHAAHESIVIEHLALRTALLAGLLASSTQQE